MRTLHHLIDPTTVGHPTDADALEFLPCRKIHVQADAFRQSFGQDSTHNFLHIRAKRLQIGIGMVIATRKSNRGNIFHTALHRHAHRARIVVVHGGIVAVVDAAEHKVGQSFSEAELVERQLHAIDRRTAARPNFHALAHVVATAQRERIGGGKRTAEARPRTFGSADEHVAERFDEIDERTDAIGLKTVVVGDQNQRSVRRVALKGVCWLIHSNFFDDSSITFWMILL